MKTTAIPAEPRDEVVGGAPREYFVEANGIRHHVVEWSARAPDGTPLDDRSVETVVLCHGFLDFAHSYVRVAVPLAMAGYRVVSFDWRGHGESGWVGPGGYYHFADYALDLEQLLPQLLPQPSHEHEPHEAGGQGPGGRVHLVGHSMGATACALFAGVRSERLLSLSLLEGLGPPTIAFESSPDRFKSWFSSTAKVAQKAPTVIEDLDEAVKRMRVQNSKLTPVFGRFLAERSTRATEDGKRTWRFDPLHRTTSPMPFRAEMFVAFLDHIKAPTLVLLGARGYRLADEAERLAHLPGATVAEIPNTGHMLHWFAADVVVAELLAHFEESRAPEL
jgi:pimeloyl-ACP methyl ester carboxylesterase